jgi:hypothetical protein
MLSGTSDDPMAQFLEEIGNLFEKATLQPGTENLRCVWRVLGHALLCAIFPNQKGTPIAFPITRFV